MHSRYPGDESIAFKNGFLHRPIVNEYAEILWKMLYKLGYKGKRKQKRFELILSHDVDQFRYFRIILGDILRRRNLKLAKEHSKYFVKLGSNPFDTFDFIMTSSEKVGLKSHFNFASSNSKLPLEPEFYLRIKRFRSTIKKIKERGHIIGFHPGYYTFNNLDKWHNEKLLLEEFVQNNIIEGRQHYLRFDVPKTFRIWDKNNMEIDSTLGYADKEGFRCGTGDLFNVFDFLERTRLNVKECPLIIMDGTLLLHRKYTQEQAMEILKYYIQIGVKYKTKITLLFHNSSFFGEWEGYKSIYTNIIELAK